MAKRKGKVACVKIRENCSQHATFLLLLCSIFAAQSLNQHQQTRTRNERFSWHGFKLVISSISAARFAVGGTGQRRTEEGRQAGRGKGKWAVRHSRGFGNNFACCCQISLSPISSWNKSEKSHAHTDTHTRSTHISKLAIDLFNLQVRIVWHV